MLDAAAAHDPLYGKGYVATADSPVTIVWVPSVEGVAGEPVASPALMTALGGVTTG